MDNLALQDIIKAIIQSSNKPIMVSEILRAFSDIDEVNELNIKEAIDALLQQKDRVQELKMIAGGYQYHIKPKYTKWILQAQGVEAGKRQLPKALIETLAIIAYKQPVSRSEIEAIRGCQTNLTVYNELETRGWIKVVEYGGVNNMAMLYGTTMKFLEHFGLNSIFDLPDMESFKITEEIF